MSNARLELGGGDWAAKDGNLLGYAVGDTSGKYLPREFTFSRGADIAATRVNKDGLIEKYRENLLLQSNQFDTTWSLDASMTLTSGQSGYDGSSDAWLLDKTAIQFRAVRQNPVHSNVVTFSVYAKQGTLRYLNYYSPVGDAPQIWFDLQAGVVATKLGTYIEVKMESVGGGWYRCSVTYDAASGGEVRIYPQDLDGSYGSVAGNIYIQDAQLEQGLVATDYLESGSTTGKAGVLDNLPRIDYTSGSAQLLVEPDRTNLIEQSEYFDHTSWIDTSATRDITVTQVSETTPDGGSVAYKIQGTAYTHQLAALNTIVIGDVVTNSIYVKRVSGTGDVRLRDVNNTGTLFSLSAADGWKRIDVTATATSANGRFYINLETYTDEILVWGAQQEKGDFATSYIPTYGASDTRAYDFFSDQTFNDVLGNGDLSVLVDFDYASPTTEGSTLLVSLFSGSDILGIKGDSTTDKDLQIYASGNFSGAINFNDTEQATRIKALIRTNGATVELFFNGAKDTETITFGGSLPYAWDDLRVTGNDSLLAEFNRIAIFTESLSDAECIALTTV